MIHIIHSFVFSFIVRVAILFTVIHIIHSFVFSFIVRVAILFTVQPLHMSFLEFPKSYTLNPKPSRCPSFSDRATPARCAARFVAFAVLAAVAAGQRGGSPHVLRRRRRKQPL